MFELELNEESLLRGKVVYFTLLQEIIRKMFTGQLAF